MSPVTKFLTVILLSCILSACMDTPSFNTEQYIGKDIYTVQEGSTTIYSKLLLSLDGSFTLSYPIDKNEDGQSKGTAASGTYEFNSDHTAITLIFTWIFTNDSTHPNPPEISYLVIKENQEAMDVVCGQFGGYVGAATGENTSYAQSTEDAIARCDDADSTSTSFHVFSEEKVQEIVLNR